MVTPRRGYKRRSAAPDGTKMTSRLCLVLLAVSCSLVHAGYSRGQQRQGNKGCSYDLKNCRAKLQDAQGLENEAATLTAEVATLTAQVAECERPLREAERQEKALAARVKCLGAKANLGELRVENTKQELREVKCALSEYDPIVQACKQASKDLNLTRLGDNIYYFHTKLDGWLTFTEAYGFCEGHGLQLASLETREENDLVKGWVKQILDKDHPLLCAADPFLVKNFWVSLFDLDHNGQYLWAGSRVSPAFLDFLPGDVDPDDLLKDCTVVGQFKGANQDAVFWNDLQCSEKRRYICEVPETCANFIRDKYKVATTFEPSEETVPKTPPKGCAGP